MHVRKPFQEIPMPNSHGLRRKIWAAFIVQVAAISGATGVGSLRGIGGSEGCLDKACVGG
jgi:hypothetical protein